MRVAVHLPPEHPHHGGGVEGHAVIAYRLGRIEDGVHNAPLGHEPVPLQDFVDGLVKQAQAEYPDAQVVVERLVKGEGDEGRWIAAEEFDPEHHETVGPGNTRSADVHVVAEQGAS